jgi:hypothetical protein
VADVTFLEQAAPVDEYGRALYAVVRSIVTALLDQLTNDDLTDLNTDRVDVTLRQLCKVARLERDKGMRGDGFEWAVHEAIVGGEPTVCEPVSDLLRKASKYLKADKPASLLFGHERSKYLGFLDAVVQAAGESAVILPDGRGHPYAFGTWVQRAAKGKAAEAFLSPRIQQIWKTDLFLTDSSAVRYLATTIKSNWHHLEAGRGIRLAIVPEAEDLRPGIMRDQHKGLWTLALPDPDGFMGLFNDAYEAVAQAVCTMGKHDRPPYFTKPSAKAQRIQVQLEGYASAKVVDVVDALNNAAQQDLIAVDHRLVSVQAPDWLRMAEKREPVIAPKPKFEKLD